MIPTSALVFGSTGVLPFVLLTFLNVLNINFPIPNPIFAILAYGATILSFIGGIQWGIIIHKTKIDRNLWIGLGTSVFPPLLGWSSLLASGLTSYIILICGFLFALIVDHKMANLSLTPTWYFRLRFFLTLVVVVVLIINWF